MRKTVSYELRFTIEMGIGLVTFFAVLLIGDTAFALFSAITVLAFLRPKKPDERDIQLFHKANTSTLVSVYLSMFPVYFFMPGFNWLIALACSFIFFHGLWGFLMLRSG
jgi:hypothetical protein